MHFRDWPECCPVSPEIPCEKYIGVRWAAIHNDVDFEEWKVLTSLLWKDSWTIVVEALYDPLTSMDDKQVALVTGSNTYPLLCRRSRSLWSLLPTLMSILMKSKQDQKPALEKVLYDFHERVCFHKDILEVVIVCVYLCDAVYVAIPIEALQM